MEVITIDSKAYRDLMDRIEKIADYIANHGDKKKSPRSGNLVKQP